jgi:hypothetical protein
MGVKGDQGVKLENTKLLLLLLCLWQGSIPAAGLLLAIHSQRAHHLVLFKKQLIEPATPQGCLCSWCSAAFMYTLRPYSNPP